MTKRKIQILTDDEVLSMIAAWPADTRAGCRNRAVIAVLWRAGLRVSELADLTLDDLERGTIRVHNGKGSMARTCGIDADAMELVAAWIAVRPRAGTDWLFCGLFNGAAGHRLHVRWVREMLRSSATRAGITKRVHPHGMRHSHAAALAAEGVPINIISKQLGHRRSSTTSEYIDHIAGVTAASAIAQRPRWLGPRPA